jgi:predicted ribosomally synthesized peptide with SipW-like signal peptide
MNRILYSIVTIVVAVSAVVAGTGAFFSDTERARGNTFAAGVIDLKVDNESYYNGNRCMDVDDSEESEDWRWVGTAPYPEPGAVCTTSWLLDDLANGYLFFNFTDLKPDDEGEDTISLHVGTNAAWACMDVSLTSDDDRSSTEPELHVDVADVPGDTWDGELADNLEFVWWADDGDNVLETGEAILSTGVETLTDLATTSGPFSVALADASTNAWGEPVGTPLTPSETHYIGKAWCFGTLTEAAIPDDSDLHPQERGETGWSCDGTALGNETQTDGVTVDVAFRTIQARGTPDFTCDNGDTRFAKLTVIKEVINDDNGNNVVEDFLLYVDNSIEITNVTSGVTNDLVAGSYSVQEQGIPGYEASFSGDCDQFGNVTLAEGESKTCTITNDDLPASITLVKNVINDDGRNALPTGFGLLVDGNPVPHNTSVEVAPNTPHTIDETGRTGYSFVGPITGVSNYGKDCPTVLGGDITLDEGEAIVCTITNDDDPQT